MRAVVDQTNLHGSVNDGAEVWLQDLLVDFSKEIHGAKHKLEQSKIHLHEPTSDVIVYARARTRRQTGGMCQCKYLHRGQRRPRRNV